MEYIYAVLSLVFVVVIVLTIKLYFKRSYKLSQKRMKRRPVLTKKVKAIDLSAKFKNNWFFYLLVAIMLLVSWIYWQIAMINWGFAAIYLIYKPLYLFFGLYFIAQFFLSINKRYRLSLPSQKEKIKKFKTAVIVPVYNEDAQSLLDCLESLLRQSVLPQEINVVDDCSKVDYSAVKETIKKLALEKGVILTWERHKKNGGKRAAQITGIKASKMKEDGIFITIDSDGVLDPEAIAEGLIPFAIDDEIFSVAGVVLARNAQKNVLARITDMLFVAQQQLIDRAAMSNMGTVLVNSGGLAFYRWQVISACLEAGYDDETFMGRKVVFSDDSYLTLYALLLGKAVQQPSAVVFADMPENLSHHIRQQLRWFRGSFIRSLWRLKFLNVLTFGFWRQLLGLFVYFTMTTMLISLPFVVNLDKVNFLALFGVTVLFGYTANIKYFSYQRTDMIFTSNVVSYIIFTPISIFWSTIVLRFVRLYAIITCYKTGWGTRKDVEIKHEDLK